MPRRRVPPKTRVRVIKRPAKVWIWAGFAGGVAAGAVTVGLLTAGWQGERQPTAMDDQIAAGLVSQDVVDLVDMYLREHGYVPADEVDAPGPRVHRSGPQRIPSDPASDDPLSDAPASGPDASVLGELPSEGVPGGVPAEAIPDRGASGKNASGGRIPADLALPARRDDDVNVRATAKDGHASAAVTVGKPQDSAPGIQIQVKLGVIGTGGNNAEAPKDGKQGERNAARPEQPRGTKPEEADAAKPEEPRGSKRDAHGRAHEPSHASQGGDKLAASLDVKVALTPPPGREHTTPTGNQHFTPLAVPGQHTLPAGNEPAWKAKEEPGSTAAATILQGRPVASRELTAATERPVPTSKAARQVAKSAPMPSRHIQTASDQEQTASRHDQRPERGDRPTPEGRGVDARQTREAPRSRLLRPADQTSNWHSAPTHDGQPAGPAEGWAR